MTYATEEEKEETLLPNDTGSTEVPAVPTAHVPPADLSRWTGPLSYDGPITPMPRKPASPAAEGSTPPAANATTAPAVEESATAQPAQSQPTAATPATQQQLSRQAVSGYGDVAPYLAPLRAAQRDPGAYLEQIDAIDRQLPRAVEEYRRTGRNPLADIVLERQKPRKNVDEEKRLKTQAVLQSFNNLFSLLGKGIAASAGLRPAPADNKPIEEIHRRLQQLDDLYRNEKQRYDQNELLAAMRKDQAALQAAKDEVDALSARRKGYIDLYKGDLEHNRQLEEKAAELGVKSSQYRTDLQYKYDKMKSDKETADKNRAVQYARLAKEHPKIFLQNSLTGKQDELSPELTSRLMNIVGQITNRRKSVEKKSGGLNFYMNGSGMPVWAGDTDGDRSRPLPLNNYLSDEELEKLNDFKKSGELNPTAHGVLTRLYNDMLRFERGDMSALGVPELPNPTGFIMNRTKYVDDLSETIAGIMQVDAIYGGDGKLTPQEVKEMLPAEAGMLSHAELERAIRNAREKFK